MKKFFILSAMISFLIIGISGEAQAKSSFSDLLARAIKLLPVADQQFLIDSYDQSKAKPLIVVTDRELKASFKNKLYKELVKKSMFSLLDNEQKSVVPIFVRSESIFVVSLLDSDNGHQQSLEAIALASKISHEIDHFANGSEEDAIRREKQVFAELAEKYGFSGPKVENHLAQL